MSNKILESANRLANRYHLDGNRDWGVLLQHLHRRDMDEYKNSYYEPYSHEGEVHLMLKPCKLLGVFQRSEQTPIGTDAYPVVIIMNEKHELLEIGIDEILGDFQVELDKIMSKRGSENE